MAPKKSKKAWAGRLGQPTRPSIERFTASIHFDRRLYPYDIAGSIAHCTLLAEAGALTAREAARMIRGLEAIRKELDRRPDEPLPESDEDIHMHIERRLIERLGPLGRKLQTGRSRNEQVALDLRLFLRDAIDRIDEAAVGLERALLAIAKKYDTVILPAYTHLQRAQPVLLAHHLLAYCEMLERDRERLRGCRSRVNRLPGGSGAAVGTNYRIDRARLAGLLDFEGITANSLDAVSDRDFAVEFLACASLIMMHLSRLAEELVLWSTAEFGFVELPDAVCTGSSLMPQKKNPDVPELVRGKTGRVYGALIGLLTVMKGLPLAYNRDMQEDKPPVFDAADTVETSLAALTEAFTGITVEANAMRRATEGGYLLATDLADYLVSRGVPFREAHERVGRLVRYAIEKEKKLGDLTLTEFRKFSKEFQEDAIRDLALERSLERKDLPGGTAPERVRRAIQEMEQRLSRAEGEP